MARELLPFWSGGYWHAPALHQRSVLRSLRSLQRRVVAGGGCIVVGIDTDLRVAADVAPPARPRDRRPPDGALDVVRAGVSRRVLHPDQSRCLAVCCALSGAGGAVLLGRRRSASGVVCRPTDGV